LTPHVNEAGIIFRSALPEDLEWDTRTEDVALSLDAIKRCLTNMLVALDRDPPQMKGGMSLPLICTAQELMMAQEPPWLWFTLPEMGFSMLMDEYCRPIHPNIEEYMRRYVTNDQDWEKVDGEGCWGVNYTEPTTQIKERIASILHTWGGKYPGEEQDEMRKRNPEKERFSVPHASRDPAILKDRNLENEDIFEMIRNSPEVGAVRMFEKPGSWDSTAGLTQAVTTQGKATIRLPSGPLNMDGAQWHLLKHTMTNSEPSAFEVSIQNELTLQLRLDKDKKHRSFAWKLSRTVKGDFQATKYHGDTALTIPPFFKNAWRGKERIWGEEIATPQPTVINWSGLDDKETRDLTPALTATDDWILLTHPLGANNKIQPPFRGVHMIARANGKCSRHQGWWREGKDELATHSMTTEVWISTSSKIPEISRTAIQEALEADNTKDTPSFGSEDLEVIHRAGTEAGLLGIYKFPGAVYATHGSNDKGVMGAGYYRLDDNRGGCCQLGRGEEGNSSNRPELEAACLALEDAKNQQNGKPIILLSDSACFLSSSQKWIGEGKSPSMWGNPDADIMRDIVQLLRERIEQGLLTIFIKIKAHREEPLKELADRWADEGRQSENMRWSLPTNRPIFSWTDNGITHRSPMNPTVKKRIDLQVSRQQLKIHTGSTANFLAREDNSTEI